MPAVTNTVTLSDGTPAAGTVTVRLLAAGRHTIGHHTTSDYTTGYPAIIRFTGGAWSVTLDRNTDLAPAGSVWELLEEPAPGGADGGLPRPAKRYLATVPASGSGPFWVGDLVSEEEAPGRALPATAAATGTAQGATVATASFSGTPAAQPATATGAALGATVTALTADAYASTYTDTYGFAASGGSSTPESPTVTGTGEALDATVTAATPGTATPATATATGEALGPGVTVSGGTLTPLGFSSVTTSTGTAASLACIVPAAVTTGAQMFAALYVRAQETITDPAGWTRMNPSGSDGSGQVDDSGIRSVLYRRTATSADAISTTSYTWTWTSSVKAVVVMAAYGNPHATTPIRAASAVAEPGTSVTSHTTASVTPASNDWLISIFGTTSSSAWTAADTERIEVASTGTSGTSAVLADSNGGVSGGAVTRSASQANTTSAGAFYLIAVQPA